MPRIIASYAQRREIEKLLLDVLVKSQNGTCEYIMDWDDKSVAQKVSPTLGASHVANMRRLLGYGSLKGAPHTVMNKQAEDMAKSLKALQEYVGKLEWRIHILERRADPKNTLQSSASLDALEVLQQVIKQ